MEKKMTKDDYLRNKGLLPREDYGEMYTFASNREGCSEIKKILIWDKYSSTGYSLTRESNYKERREYNIDKFKFKESPYDAAFRDGEIVSEESQSGSGFGDLWAYTTFCSLDENALIKAREKEQARIKEKYLDVIDRGVELQKIIDDYSWIKVKRFDEELKGDDDVHVMYKGLVEHHKQETEFLIAKCRELAKELIEERAKPKFF